jgi:aspartyl-tRNA(Asn)/glutamyl-tRNA(Gln) amidotransferase subunit C
MSVSKDEVKYIASLAKLYFDEEQLEKMREDMDNLVAFADKLSALDTEGMEAMSHVQKKENVFDEDVPHGGSNIDEMLRNAPEREDNYFAVPKVVE